MKKYPKRTLLVNTFGTLGYLFSLVLWVWVGAIYLPVILANESIGKLIIPVQPEQVAPHAPTVGASPITVFLALAVTAVIMVITIIMLLRVPITIAKTGRKVTTKAASSVVPIVTRGKPIKQAEKWRLTVRLIKLSKLLLALLPVVIGFFGFAVELSILTELVVFLSCVLAGIAIICFGAQYLLAELLKVDQKQLV